MSRPDETIEPAEAGCRLMLISPRQLDLRRITKALDEALAVGGIAGFLLRLEPSDRDVVIAAAGAVRPLCTAHAVAFLLQDDVELALEIGADGAHLGRDGDVAAARAALGPERILGISCGTSRHAGMVAGEAGADYIAFGDPDRPPDAALVDLVRWWSGLFVLPCMAEGEIDADGCAVLKRAGADFLAVREAVWAHPDGPGAAVERLQQAIATA